ALIGHSPPGAEHCGFKYHPGSNAMAKSKSKAKSKSRAPKRASGKRAAAARGQSAAPDAIALLKADHREVEGWFEEFEKSRSDKRKLELAQKICTALKAHTTIEEEIFYPAFLEATADKDMHHEAAVEHDGAKKLIAQIEASGPDDDYYDAKVKVLSEMIKHHVKEEEQRGGMFAEARDSDMDLKALGEQLKARKQQLMSERGGPMRGRNATGANAQLHA
ncbi:MAG TPA: hemerythrin domain-containing protein, partial [Steroidobacteraceae bacterium]|nr:hemerythrin domain-containing protein [Steroidobacteraceae bacterium]